MRKRILIVVAGVILSAGGFAVALNPQTEIAIKADVAVARPDKVEKVSGKTLPRLTGGDVALTGDVSFQVNGVLVRADRAVVNQREVTLEGNVRMTLPPPK